MKRLFLVCAGLVLLSVAQAHDLHYSATQGEAVVLRLFYGDDSGFRFEAYEIYRAGDNLPYQVGRTDAQGRIAFLPDQAGSWRLIAFSEDGHGLDIQFSTDDAARLSGLNKPFYDRYGRILVGVALILGLFGLFSLFLNKRVSP